MYNKPPEYAPVKKHKAWLRIGDGLDAMSISCLIESHDEEKGAYELSASVGEVEMKAIDESFCECRIVSVSGAYPASEGLIDEVCVVGLPESWRANEVDVRIKFSALFLGERQESAVLEKTGG